MSRTFGILKNNGGVSMKKKSILLFISLMFLTLNACSESGLPALDFEHKVDKSNPLKIHFSTVVPESEEYGDLTLEWDMGDGTILKEDQVAHTYKDQGDYKVKLSLKSSKEFMRASETVKNIKVTVNFRNIDFTFEQDNMSSPRVEFIATGEADGGLLDFSWNFEGHSDQFDNGRKVIRTYPSRSKVTVVLTATVIDTGVTSTITKIIDLNPIIESVSFTYGPYLTPNVIQFKITTIPKIENAIYVFDYGDGTGNSYDSDKDTPRHHYEDNASGLYNVTLTAKMNPEDEGVSFNKNAQIGDIDVDVSFVTESNPANLLEIAFSTISSPDIEGTIYEWNIDGTGYVKDREAFTYAFAEYGPHTVSLKADIPKNKLDSYDNRTIYIAPPSIDKFDFIITPTNHPLEFKVEAKGKLTGPGTIEFLWSYKDTQVATGRTALIKFNEYGTENITLNIRVDDILLTNPISHEVIKPSPSFTAAYDYDTIREVNPLDVYFEATSTITPADNTTFKHEVEYEWDYGFGNTAKGQKVNHTFKYTGSYQVTMTARIVGTSIEKKVTRHVNVDENILVKIICMGKEGYDINNITYECSAESSPLLKNPQFKWIVKDSDNKTVIKESPDKSFEVTFDKLDLYHLELVVSDLVFEDGKSTIYQGLAALTVPGLYSRSWVVKCSATWGGDRSIHSYIDNLWEVHGEDVRINRDNVIISVDIAKTAYYSASHGYHSPAANKYWIQLKNQGDKRNPWKNGVNTDVIITYKINGFPPISKKHNVYFAGGKVHDCP